MRDRVPMSFSCRFTVLKLADSSKDPGVASRGHTPSLKKLEVEFCCAGSGDSSALAASVQDPSLIPRTRSHP